MLIVLFQPSVGFGGVDRGETLGARSTSGPVTAQDRRGKMGSGERLVSGEDGI